MGSGRSSKKAGKAPAPLLSSSSSDSGSMRRDTFSSEYVRLLPSPTPFPHHGQTRRGKVAGTDKVRRAADRPPSQSFSNDWERESDNYNYEYKYHDDKHGDQSKPSRTSTSRSTKPSSKPSSPTTNVYTYCGRHSDQWLLGGRSMTDMFRRSSWKKGDE